MSTRVLEWFLAAVLATALSGCTQRDLCPESETVLCTSKIINAKDGGSVAFDTHLGSASLDIPPNALDKNTLISVSTSADPTAGRVHARFEPSGLKFDKPVTLTLPMLLDENGEPPSNIQFFHTSALNPQVDVGSEVYQWEDLQNIVVDPATQTIRGDMRHFSQSTYGYGISENAYLVIDLPGQYMRAGDMVTVLTSRELGVYNWYPGHVGLVRSIDPDTGETMIIESTHNKSGSVASGDGEKSGVILNDLDNFKVGHSHVFMGARRPPGNAMSDAQRRSTVEYAVDQFGEAYAFLGAPLIGNASGWSCTGLVEASFEESGRGVMGTFDFFPTPAEMFDATVPVSEIDVELDKEVKIPVYPIVISPLADPDGLGTDGYYRRVNTGATVTAQNLPDGATFAVDPNHRYQAPTLTWTPTKKYAGLPVTVTFNMTGSVTIQSTGKVINYALSQDLTMQLPGTVIPITIQPVGFGSTGQYHAYARTLDASTTEIIDEDMIDLETGAFPTNPIFPNQIIDEFSIGWIDGVEDYYGCTFHIARLDDPFTTPPPGIKTYTCWYSWKLDPPPYNGLN